MAEWCMAHPWMTFWIAIVGLICLGEALEAFAKRR
jgi:hypothetical protein